MAPLLTSFPPQFPPAALDQSPFELPTKYIRIADFAEVVIEHTMAFLQAAATRERNLELAT
ncbi:MAG: hypothetical protein OSA40_12270 [Phycisphaerales bacterium]|nr:hypothetical protein [Phycisphaerales bacterium]